MIIKPVMLDETGQTTNQKIDNLNTQITEALTSLATDINTALTDYSGAQEETLSGFAEDMNTTLSGFASDMNATLTNLSNELVGVLVSLKSVNGKYGAVVLDSGDIVISKSVSGSKTIAQVLAEIQTAISLTPLDFGVEQISGTEDEYLLTIDQGTPS